APAIRVNTLVVLGWRSQAPRAGGLLLLFLTGRAGGCALHSFPTRRSSDLATHPRLRIAGVPVNVDVARRTAAHRPGRRERLPRRDARGRRLYSADSHT